MQTKRIAIIGAGLSGLYAAWRLQQQGIRDYVLLEARDAPGGRIVSVTGPESTGPGPLARSDSINRFDLGPTWFWPELQPQLQQLIHDLGLESFAQFETGDMMVERSRNSPATQVPGYLSSPVSMRLVGGMAALIDALRQRLDASTIMMGQVVRRMRCHHEHVELQSEDADRHLTTWRVEHVLLALPPRLAEAGIVFSPALPQDLAQQWRMTATWMAPHAKYIAVYDYPFWRERGLSGEARSAVGPLGEIHDASMPGGSAALFGFFGVPAQVRSSVPDPVLREHCRAQLVRLFGAPAATVTAEFIKDWAQDPFTANAADRDGAAGHTQAPDSAATSGAWSGRLTGIGSEWSRQYPGYIAGAIEAASIGVHALPPSLA